jgi:hypothetical protein
MMAFHVGQKVVCVNASRPARRVYLPDDKLPLTGGIYTVREISDSEGTTCLLLNEIINKPRQFREGFCEGAFTASRFRPVKTTDIEVFHRLLAPTGKRKARQSA